MKQLAVIALLGLAAMPALARPLEAVKAAGTLRVTVYTSYKPWSWVENGVHRGIDVDIAAALGKAMSLRIDYFYMRADDNVQDDLRNGVWRGTVFGQAPGDVMMHVPYDKELEAENDRIALASPYHVDGLAMAIDPRLKDRALDFSVFETEKVSVDVGTMADIVLVSARDHKLIPNVVHVRGTERAAAAFEKGEVAAFYGEASAIETFAAQGKRPFAIIYPKSNVAREWSIGLATKSDSRDLATALAGEMTKLEASGELKAIFGRYNVNWRKPD